MGRTLRLALALTSLALFVFAPRALVARAQPTCQTTGTGSICRQTVVLDSTGVIPGSDNPCGFDIAFALTGTIDVTQWYDQNGNLLKQFNAGATTISLSANGRTLSTRDIAYPHIDFVDGTVKVTGMQEVWKIPGQQPIVIAGQQLVDLNTGEVIAQHGTFADFITPAMCQYLSGS